jgi:hypothetical protein
MLPPAGFQKAFKPHLKRMGNGAQRCAGVEFTIKSIAVPAMIARACGLFDI